MSPTRLYCDTSIYVALILGPRAPGYIESRAMLQAAEGGTYEGVLSALVPAEVIGAPTIRAPQGVPKAEAVKRMAIAMEYFQRSPFRYLEIDKRAGLRAAQIARDHEMKGADALHLAVAELSGCNLFCTLDHDQLKVGDRLSGLVISRPQGPAQAELEFS